MTDILHILPSFPADDYSHLLPSLERSMITTTDLMILDPGEIAKRAQLHVANVRSLSDTIRTSLRASMGLGVDGTESTRAVMQNRNGGPCLRHDGRALMDKWSMISTLDDGLDAALGGGIPTGYVTEITGER